MKKLLSLLSILIVLSAGIFIGLKIKVAKDNSPTNTEDTLRVDGENTLDLSNDRISAVTKSVYSETNTKVLDLSHNSLKTLPSEIGKMTKVEELYLNDNQLEGSLVAEIRQMSNLRILDASNNNLTGLIAEIGQLDNLETLNLANNDLTDLPKELQKLTGLKTLNLSGNRVSSSTIATLKSALQSTEIVY